MIGSCICCCTNHLYGTGIHDLNCGGSVLCSNTSFTHCTTTTEYSNEHRTTQTKITTADTLHLFSLCTFKACSATSGGGGAIVLSQISADLEIASCSFESCGAPKSSGGALFFQQSTAQKYVVISSSSFVKCASNVNAGGSLYLQNIASLSISDCVFLTSRTNHFGGAVYLSQWDAEMANTALSNCLFDDCATSRSSSLSCGGGAIYFWECSSIRLDFLQFRECVAATGNGNDLYFNGTLPTVSLTTVSNCDSTSTPQASRIYPTTIAVDDVLPDPTETISVMSLNTQQTTSTTVEIVITMDKEVTGSLLVLVSNSEGTARTDTTKAPNIGRVLVFSIESSKIGRCTVSIGDMGLLQVPLEEYKIVTASFPNCDVSFSDVSLENTKNPTFTSAKCVLDDTCTCALLNLEGSDVDGETFELTLRNGWTLEATFTNNKATIDLGVIGESSKWMENQVFEITGGKKMDDNSIVASIPSPLYFTIPLAARLSDIVVSDLNAAKTKVTLSFSTRLLKGNSNYEVRIEKVIGSELEVMELKTNAEGLIVEETITLLPSGSNTEGWKNWIGGGGSFKVVGVLWKRLEGDVAVQFSSIVFNIPVEVVRVSSAKCSTNSAATTIVSIVGNGLIENETYTLTLSGKPKTDPHSQDVHDTTIYVVASSSTEAKSLPLLLSSTSESSLLFGHTYTITAITNGSVAGIVEDTPSFTTRPTPTLTSLSCKLKEGDPKTAAILISGTNIPDGLYSLVLKKTVVGSTEIELPMKIVESAGRLEIEVFSSSSLEYGAEYQVLSLSNSLLTVALPTSATDRLLEVPGTPARVRSVSCELSGDLKTHAKIMICGENLPVKGTLSVKVKQVGSTGSTIDPETALPVTTITNEESTTIEIEVYEAMNPCLEDGKTYELTSLTFSGTVSFILDESVRFSVPVEPVRITSASCTKDDTDRTVVSVEGSGFVLREFYTITVSGHPIGSLSPPPSSLHDTSFVVIASSSKKATSSPLQLHPAERSHLKFSYSYTIVGISNGSVEGVVHSAMFETQSDFKRDEALVTRIEPIFASSLNTSIVNSGIQKTKSDISSISSCSVQTSVIIELFRSCFYKR